MNIQNSTLEDIEDIFALYKIGTDLQKLKFPENQWPKFDRKLIELEINEERQWKIIIDNKIACTWAITFNDPQIWEERDVDPSVYIHRIATNPEFRGQKFVSKIVDWARDYFPGDFCRFDQESHGEDSSKASHLGQPSR